MDAHVYLEILKRGLLRDKYPQGGYHFQQDNDPKHTGRVAKDFFMKENINWWKTPDLNPQERVWAAISKLSL